MSDSNFSLKNGKTSHGKNIFRSGIGIKKVALSLLLLIFMLQVATLSMQNSQHGLSAASSGYSFPYTVQSGDTLHAIGQKFGVSWQAIAGANNIASPYTIYVGQVLQIPSSQPITLYTVQDGDYLSLIGQKFSISWQSIAQLNNIQSPYILYPGEQLEIPVSAPTVYYTVQPGDYLILIGQKLGVSWQAVAQANNLLPPYLLSVGQQLVIPQSSSSGNGSGGNPPPTDPIAVGNPTEDQYDQIILAATSGTNVDPMMIKADIMTESGFNPNALSNVINYGCGGTHDMGLLQINPVCSGADASQLLNPTYNIDYGVKLYSGLYGQMTREFSGCSTLQYWEMALGDYNTGNGVYGCTSMSGQAQWYSSTVMNYYWQFSSEAGYTGTL
ncbi:MAG: LysM peptidoglycan-binding domain-containing protein [Nitrososphaerales archaeon]